jgi:hypothetical protein
VKSCESVSEEIEIISLLNNHDSCLESVGHLSGTDEGGLSVEALLLELANLVVGFLGRLGDDEELRLGGGGGIYHVLLIYLKV